MISERSCDTEDWSNDAENSALHHRNNILKYIKLDNIILNCNDILQYCYIYCIFGQINAALVSIRDYQIIVISTLFSTLYFLSWNMSRKFVGCLSFIIQSNSYCTFSNKCVYLPNFQAFNHKPLYKMFYKIIKNVN